MRKLLVGFVILSVALALPGTVVNAAQGLTGGPARQVRGGAVRYRATTSCHTVYLRSNPGGSTTALVPQTKTVHGGSVSFYRVVRAKAAFKKFSVVAYCSNRSGKRIGTISLTVTKGTARRLSGTGLPILPQVLLAVVSLGAGSLLLLAGRRRRFENLGSWRARGH